MFVGVYGSKYNGLLPVDTPQPHTDKVDAANSCDLYDLTLDAKLDDLIGRIELFPALSC